jgi:hypothetical protein
MTSERMRRKISEFLTGLPSALTYRKPFPDFFRRIPGCASETHRNPASFAESAASVTTAGRLFVRALIMCQLDAELALSE